MSYPLGMIWDEVQLVTERLNGLEASRAVLTQLAVSSVISKEAGTEFRKAVDKLIGDH